jgi:DNA-binding transcriptional MerR regulator
MQQLTLFGVPEAKIPGTEKQEEEINYPGKDAISEPLNAEEIIALKSEEVLAEIIETAEPERILQRINEENVIAVEEIGTVEKPKNTEGIRPVLNDIIFSNQNIAVRVKKVEVKQEPLPQNETVVSEVDVLPAAENTKKRGRKSYKEIDTELDLIDIPDDEILFEKQYYPITQVAKWFNVNTSLLRYWEGEFDILQPRKNKKGDRLFRPEDVKSLQVIYYLLRQRKFTIEGAKAYLKTNKKTADTNLQLINALTKFRSFLLELKANLDT